MDDARTFLDIFFVVVLRRRVGQEDKLQEQKPSREDAKSGGKERGREREKEKVKNAISVRNKTALGKMGGEQSA